MESLLADQARDVDAVTQTISDSIMSPFCPGRTLSACPSGKATDLRAEIKGWLTQGYSEAAVYNQLRVRYGETVTGVPASSGVGLLGWFAPAIFVAFALLVVARKLRSMRRERVVTVRSEIAGSETADPAFQSKVEAELKQRLVTRR